MGKSKAELQREYSRRCRDVVLAYQRAWAKTPLGRYTAQKKNAAKRHIPFLLTFDEWWSIWQESGKWEERGVGADKFCMCRTNDVGPYEMGNVRIDTHSNNGKENNESGGKARSLSKMQGTRTGPQG